jgi:hypothetical protein
MNLETAIEAITKLVHEQSLQITLRPTKLLIRPVTLAECGLTIEDVRAMVAVAEVELAGSEGRENPMKK